MAGLLIKNLPKKLHDQLKERAVRNHRSLTKEALAILEDALLSDRPRPSLEEIDRWRVRGAKPLTDRLLRRARTEGRA